MDFEMGEREDFGDWGDERMLGSCQADWLDETYSSADRFEFWRERQRERELEEIKLEFADEANDARGHELDLCDIVREHDEREDWVQEADDLQEWRNPELNDDYLDCNWEE